MTGNDWPRVKINSVCEAIIDCVNKTAPTVEGPTPFRMIRTTNVRDGWVDTKDVKYVSEQTYKIWTRRGAPKKGDVILTREAPLGEVGLLRDDSGVFLGQRLVMYRADRTRLDERFLLYSFLSRDMQAQIQALGSGATVAHMRVPDAENLEVALPPLAVQKRIADILSAYDNLIDNNTRRITILEEMARAIYREWFVEFRFPGHDRVEMVESEWGPVPAGWKRVLLGEMCRLTMGQSPKSEHYNEEGNGLPFHQGVTDFGPRFPTNRMYCTAHGRIAEEGDVLFSVRAPVGRINVAPTKLVLGRGLSAIRSRDDCQEYLFYQLKELFKEEDSMGGGTIFKSVTKDDMLDIRLLAAPTSIINHFERVSQPMSALIKNLTTRNINLAQTRDLVLPRLISGEIDVEALDRELVEAVA